MSDTARRARDLKLLDAVDAFKREPFSEPVWRIVRSGRDPLMASPSRSRWCNGAFDVLYTSLEEDGAIAEIHAMLMLQPVFPSGLTWFVHKIKIFANQTLRIADLPTLQKLGVDISHYSSRDYGRTQEIADAAYFLGFDGLIAPSARWACLNAVLFIDRILPEHIAITQSAAEPVLFDEWRKRHRKS